MTCILYRRWLAGLVVVLSSWSAPLLSHAAKLPAGYLAPAPDALASAQRFVALCEAKLQLAPAQAASLHTYLNQEIDYLRLLALHQPALQATDLTTTETQQFGQVMARLLSPSQLRQYRQLQATPQAQAYLHSMALLPEAPTPLAKKNQRRTGTMLAQRLEAEE